MSTSASCNRAGSISTRVAALVAGDGDLDRAAAGCGGDSFFRQLGLHLLDLLLQFLICPIMPIGFVHLGGFETFCHTFLRSF